MDVKITDLKSNNLKKLGVDEVEKGTFHKYISYCSKLIYDDVEYYYFIRSGFLSVYFPTIVYRSDTDYCYEFKYYVNIFHSIFDKEIQSLLYRDIIIKATSFNNIFKFYHPWIYQDDNELRKNKLKKIL